MADANSTSQRLQDRRPLSPHLQVYKMMFSMVMSGLHRITGMALYAGTLLLAWYFIAAASGPAAFETVNWVYSSFLGRLVLFGFTWSLFHHLMGGVRHAAEILNFVGSNAETAVIDNVREYDPELAQKILDEMFVFENLLDIDDRGIQSILREVQSDSLIIALKGAPPELREKIFKNMSSRAAEMLREDLEARGPVRLSEVEAEQKEILKTVRRLAEEGQVMLGGKGGDDGFV